MRSLEILFYSFIIALILENVLCMVDCRVLVVDFVDGKPGYSLKETTATISAAGTAAESSMDDVPHQDTC